MQEKNKLASPHIISICMSLFQFCYIIFTTKWGGVNCKTKLKNTDFSGLTSNRETGLGLGIRASHKGIDGRHCGLWCNSNLPLLKKSSNFDKHFTETVLPTGVIFNIKPESQQHRRAASLCTLSKSFLLRWINMDLCPLQKKISQLTKQDGEEILGDVELIYPFPIITGGLYRAQIFLKNDYSSEFALPEAVTQKCMWRPCESGRFSYGESPRTPPREGTSLHRRHNRYSVERPWGIFSLFTTGFWLRVNSPCQRL